MPTKSSGQKSIRGAGNASEVAKRGPRTDGDLWDRLVDQLDYINSSAKGYDEGKEREAVRLALAIRVLVHEGTGTSLLQLLGIKHQLQFIGTAVERKLYEKALENYFGAPSAGMASGAVGFLDMSPLPDGTYEWIAPLREFRFIEGTPQADATRTLLPFDEWWNDPVIETGDFQYLTRAELITIMANQDGGAHVSEKLDLKYSKFKEQGFGIFAEWSSNPFETDPTENYVTGADKFVRNDPAAASARQIAFEIALTIHRYIDTLPEDDPLRVKRKPIYTFERERQIAIRSFPQVMISIPKGPEAGTAIEASPFSTEQNTPVNPAREGDPLVEARASLAWVFGLGRK